MAVADMLYVLGYNAMHAAATWDVMHTCCSLQREWERRDGRVELCSLHFQT